MVPVTSKPFPPLLMVMMKSLSPVTQPPFPSRPESALSGLLLSLRRGILRLYLKKGGTFAMRQAVCNIIPRVSTLLRAWRLNGSRDQIIIHKALPPLPSAETQLIWMTGGLLKDLLVFFLKEARGSKMHSLAANIPCRDTA